jgi:hypothetical protein
LRWISSITLMVSGMVRHLLRTGSILLRSDSTSLVRRVAGQVVSLTF